MRVHCNYSMRKRVCVGRERERASEREREMKNATGELRSSPYALDCIYIYMHEWMDVCMYVWIPAAGYQVHLVALGQDY